MEASGVAMTLKFVFMLLFIATYSSQKGVDLSMLHTLVTGDDDGVSN